MNELENKKQKEVAQRNETYRINSEFLVVHLQNHLDSLQYCRGVVPESLEIKNRILKEYHAIP